ncbi:hypothetical protein [Micromonospora sp. DT47]|uniref:hypothetical protein n=1 Tax=Micromonospora sp. DT47 TaxID=3393431 RepID=UPI003CF304EA
MVAKRLDSRYEPGRLGIHIGSAAAWQRASNGDWAAYAAQISRRPNHHPSGDPR